MSVHSLTPDYLSGYERGCLDGVEIGRRQLELEIAETQRVALGRALQSLALRDAGVVCPGVSE